jgi:hypothetical protein
MTARFPNLDVILCGQSQAVMFANGGGETVDGGLADVARVRLQNELATLAPGVTCFVGPAGSNVTFYADSPLFEEYRGVASEAFFDASPFANRSKGTSQRNYINGRGAANKAGLVVIYQHAQDVAAGVPGFPAGYAAGVGAYVDALIADAGTAGWGDFAILPVLSTTRGNGSEEHLTAYRRAWAAVAGDDVWQGLTRRPQVLTPLYNITTTPAIAVNGADQTHFTRIAAHRNAIAIAQRAAGWLGFATPMADQPRLRRARLITPTTVRAFIATGKRGAALQLQNVATARWSFIGGGTVSAVSAVNNADVATTGYATIDLTVSGVVAGSSRLRFSANFATPLYQNGHTPPRGPLLNAAWGLAPGTTLATVTDTGEDVKLPSGQYAIGMANCDAGVIVEAAA